MTDRDIKLYPYQDRRFIVVANPAPVDDEPRTLGRSLARIWKYGLAGSVAVIAVEVAVEKFSEAAKKDQFDGELLEVTRSESAQLTFPVGHPRRKVVYVGHPVDPTAYVTLAQFHTFLFEHKVAEALRLIRSLAANPDLS